MEDNIVIETSDLASLIGTDQVYILDGTFTAAYSQEIHFLTHIPGARFFNLKEIRNTSSSHPTALPTVSQFRDAMIHLGIKNNGTPVVVYDTLGVVTAPRVWWMLKYYGYQDVKILNGGLPKWIEEGRATESEKYSLENTLEPEESDFKFEVKSEMLAVLKDVEECVKDLKEGKCCKILWESRPVEACNTSLIPGARVLAVRDMYHPNKTIKSKEEVRRIFREAEFDLGLPVIATCMLGVAASNAYFIMNYIGEKDVKLYAGSYTEWSSSREASE